MLCCLSVLNLVLLIILSKVRFGGAIMSRISQEQVKHVAHLARLSITEEEAERFQGS